MLKVGYDLEIFTNLTGRAEPFLVDELASGKSVDPLLMSRVLQYVSLPPTVSSLEQTRISLLGISLPRGSQTLESRAGCFTRK